MTSTFMRPAIALALALGLAGCGGGKASFPITGTIVGLSYDKLVLNTNGMDLPVTPPVIGATAPAAVSFRFPNALSYGDVYNVTVAHQPDHQTCSVGAFSYSTVLTGASDTAGRLSTINIGVSCSLIPHKLTGKLINLTSAGLKLTNGTAGPLAPAATDTTFAFPDVNYGVTYGVAILAQPENAVCTVSDNGTGTMGDADVEVTVTCSAKAAPAPAP